MNTSNSLNNILADLMYLVVGISTILYFAQRRQPRYANFRLLTKRSFAAFFAADILMYGTTYLAEHQLPVGSARQMLAIIGAGIAICIAMAIHNVRKTGPVFGLAATVVQVTLYSITFPALLAWIAYRLLRPIVFDRRPYIDPDAADGTISDDEMLKVNLYSRERQNPGEGELGY